MKKTGDPPNAHKTELQVKLSNHCWTIPDLIPKVAEISILVVELDNVFIAQVLLCLV